MQRYEYGAYSIFHVGHQSTFEAGVVEERERERENVCGASHLHLGVGHTLHVCGGDGGAGEALAGVVLVAVHHATLQVTARRLGDETPASRRRRVRGV